MGGGLTRKQPGIASSLSRFIRGQTSIREYLSVTADLNFNVQA